MLRNRTLAAGGKPAEFWPPFWHYHPPGTADAGFPRNCEEPSAEVGVLSCHLIRSRPK
jgi:hypothetical protein